MIIQVSVFVDSDQHFENLFSNHHQKNCVSLVEGIKLNSDHWHDCQSKHIVIVHLSIKIMMFVPLTMIPRNASHIVQTSSDNSLWKAGLLTQNASESKPAVTSTFKMFH